MAESEAKFRAITNSVDQMIWSTRPDGYHDYYNDRWYEFTGVPAGSTDGEGWSGMFHPDDQERAWQVWSHSLATGEPYEVEYRLRRHDGLRLPTGGCAIPASVRRTRSADLSAPGSVAGAAADARMYPVLLMST